MTAIIVGRRRSIYHKNSWRPTTTVLCTMVAALYNVVIWRLFLLLLLFCSIKALAPISRRNIFSETCKNSCIVAAVLSIEAGDVAAVAAPVFVEVTPPPSIPRDTLRPVVSLITGVQYSDLRVGQGDSIQQGDIVILHLRSLLRDGSVLFDTREDEDGTPLMYQVGSIQDYNFFGGDSSKRSKVTLAVEDAILSRGSGAPMKAGGIRLVIAPGPLAYGNAGVSRYDALKMKLRQGVPRDAQIRYEIEILRCLDVKISDDDDSSFRTVCCTEPNFPCKTE